MSEALSSVKSELGSDAVLLSTKRRRRKDPATGKTTYFIEITAAIDREPVKTDGNTPVTPKRGVKPRSLSNEEAYAPSPLDPAGPSLLMLYQTMSMLGMDAAMHQPMAATYLNAVRRNHLASREMILRWLKKLAEKRIKSVGMTPQKGSPLWLAVVGPPGAGKTSTLAKFAAKLGCEKGLKGAMISTDTHRLGGLDQLSSFSALTGIPLYGARSIPELVKAFAENDDKDFILVDTTGHGRTRDGKEDLERLFMAIPAMEGLGILPANHRSEDVWADVKFYNSLPLRGWAVTKTDETINLGSLWRPLVSARIQVGLVSTGPKIPQDLKEASPGLLATMMTEVNSCKERPMTAPPFEGGESHSEDHGIISQGIIT